MRDQADEELEVLLQSDAKGLAIALLGEPNKRLTDRKAMKWGSKGSLSLSLQGPKRGSWFNHEAGYGGGPLQLIVHVRFCSYPDAKDWARQWLSLSAEKRTIYTGVHPAAGLLAKLADATGPDADDAKRIATARRLWGASVPVAGTLGEHYLTQRRGVPCPPDGWPDAVRFHPDSRALIVAATTADGDVQAVQRVLLTDDGSKIGAEAAAKLCPPTAKVTNGVQAGAVIRLPARSPDAPLLLAEGPETGLSVWAATGAETWIGLGSMTRIELPTGRRIAACRDDDPRYSPADLAIRKALRAWRKSGVDIVGVTPWRVRRFDKSDFNDVIRAEGAGAARDAVMLALDPSIGTGSRPKKLPADIRHELGLATAYVAWIALKQSEEFWRHPTNGHPIALGARIDVGVGKSTVARGVAAELLALMRQRNDNRTVAMAVPTHRLGDEQAIAFNELPRSRQAGLDAAVWRGREAIDPQAPSEKMCRNLPVVHDAMAAGLSVQAAVCRRVINGITFECPFFDQCGYQRQARRKADLWMVPHELIFHEKPDAIGDLAEIVVDESAWADGLEGTGTPPITLALDTLDAGCDIPGDAEASARLRFLRLTVLDVLWDHLKGPIKRDAIRRTGLTSASADEARGLEWRRMVDVGMMPGMPAKARRQASETGASNLMVRKLALLWTAIGALLTDDGPEASGWARLDDAASDHGTVRVIVLKGRKPIREGWRVPTLLIDANLNPDLVRPWWPAYVHAVDAAAMAPHQRVRQVMDRSYSKAHLGQTGATDAKSGQRHMLELGATLDRAVRNTDGRGMLVVANKAVEDALPRVWHMPPGVDVAHFNAIAGQDGWRSVGSLITIGSTNLPPAAVERLAEAITGAHVPPLAGWYERVAVTRETTVGLVLSEAERHPHPIAEAVRWQIREGEVIQAIGRARGVNRTGDDPVDVLVLGDVVLPMEVEAVDPADLEPTPAELMMAAAGIALDNAGHAARGFPDLWPSADAARQAMNRARSVTHPYEELLIRMCHTPPAGAVYRLAGAGQKDAIAWCDLNRVPDPAAWLTARLGPLARCDLTPLGAIEPEAA